MCEGTIWDKRRILDDFVVGLVGSSYFEFVVVQEVRGGIDFRKERLVGRADDTDKGNGVR